MATHATFRGIESVRDREQIVDLLDRAFGRTILGQNLVRAVWHPDYFDPGETRVAVVDERVVSVIVYGLRQVAFPPVLLSAATIGPVATAPDSEGRGYSRALMLDTLRHIQTRGVEAVFIQGIPNYYSRFGFYPYLAKSKVRVDCDLVPAVAGVAVVPYQPAHRSALEAIYQEAAEGRICAAQRDRRIWDWLTGPATESYYFHQPLVVLGADGSVYGYLTQDPEDATNIREVMARRNPVACAAVLWGLAQLARARGETALEIKQAWDDYFMTYLRLELKGTFMQFCHSDGGSLLKVYSAQRTLLALRPYLQQRLEGLELPDATVLIETGGERVGLRLTQGRVEVGQGEAGELLSLPQKMLPGLLTGYYAFAHLAPFLPQVSANAGRTLTALFPSACPFLYQGDNY